MYQVWLVWFKKNVFALLDKDNENDKQILFVPKNVTCIIVHTEANFLCIIRFYWNNFTSILHMRAEFIRIPSS